MLDYNASSNLYLVKRVSIPEELQECERETLSRYSVRSAKEERNYDYSNRNYNNDRSNNYSSSSIRRKSSRQSQTSTPEQKLSATSAERDIRDSAKEEVPGRSSVTMAFDAVSQAKRVGGEKASRTTTLSPILKSFKPSPISRKSQVSSDVGGDQAERPPTKTRFSLGEVKMKKGGLESVDGMYYWLPRVRVMFMAEDPKVFTSRVAHAHMSR